MLLGCNKNNNLKDDIQCLHIFFIKPQPAVDSRASSTLR